VVGEEQVAVLVRDGRVLDALGPGRHVLTAESLPLLREMAGPQFSDGRAMDVAGYLVNTRSPLSMKWGTREPIRLRSPLPGDAHVRSYGCIEFGIAEPRRFVGWITGLGDAVQAAEIVEGIRNLALASLAQALDELGEPGSEVPWKVEEVAALMEPALLRRCEEAGIALQGLTLLDISVSWPGMLDRAPSPDDAIMEQDGFVLDRYGWPPLNSLTAQFLVQPPGVTTPGGATPGDPVPEIMDAAQAAAYLGLTEAEVVALIEGGELKGKRIGSGYRIAKARVAEWRARRDAEE
jgi:excisionase family DNA binding protein